MKFCDCYFPVMNQLKFAIFYTEASSNYSLLKGLIEVGRVPIKVLVFETKAVEAKNLFSLIRCTARKTCIDRFTAKLIFLRKVEEIKTNTLQRNK